MRNKIIFSTIIIVFVLVIAFLLIKQQGQAQTKSSSTISNNYNYNSTTIAPSTTTNSTTTIAPSTTINSTYGNYNGGSQPALPSCGSNYTLFAVPIFNPNSVTAVLPLADYVPPDHVFPTPHAYIYTDNPTTHQSKDGAYFYAPTNMVLTQFAIRHATSPSGVNQTDYTLVLQSCKEFSLYFHNVASLLYPPFINASLQLKKQCGNQNQAYCSASVDIPIIAGQAIGTIGNSSAGILGLDIGARDYRLPTGRNFIDPNRLCRNPPSVFDRCYAVCPYSYFTQQIQQQIHFSSDDGSVNGTSCGTVYQDVNGTAEGYWFPANNSTSSISPEATDIFLGHDNLQPSLNIFSIGVSVPGLQPSRYAFQPKASGLVNRDFANVTPNSAFCYEANRLSGISYSVFGPPTIIYIQLLNKTTLQIQVENATACGNGPWTMWLNSAEFVR